MLKKNWSLASFNAKIGKIAFGIICLWTLSSFSYVLCVNRSIFHLTSDRTDQMSDDLAMCTGAIVKRYFEKQRFTIVVSGSNKFYKSAFGLTTFLKSFKGGIVLRFGKFQSKAKWVVVRQFIVYITDLSELSIIFESLSHRTYDNTGRFVIVCFSTAKTKCNETSILSMCWTHYAHNIVLLVWSNFVSIYTYLPYTSNWCGEVHPFIIDEWSRGIGFESNTNLFPEKVSNLFDCTVFVSTFHQPPFVYLKDDSIKGGIDGSLLQMLSDSMNFRIKLVYPMNGSAWGSYDGKKWTGSLSDVVYGRANVSVSAAVITVDREVWMQMTHPYHSIDLVWIAPPLEEIPSWKKLMFPFQNKTWLALILSYILAITIMKIVQFDAAKNFWEHTLKMDKLPDSLVTVSWFVFMGQNLERLPRRTFARFIVLQWIWFAFFVRNGYQSSLVGFLKDEMYAENFHNLPEAIDAGYSFGGVPNLRDYFSDNDRSVYNNFIEIDSINYNNAMELVSQRKSKFVMLANQESVLDYIQSMDGDGWIHIVDEKAVSSPQVMFLRKYSPLTEPFNAIITQVKEAGFIEFFLSKFSSRNYFKMLFKFWKTDVQAVLTIENLAGSFSLLLLGIGASAVTFIVEYFQSKDAFLLKWRGV